MEARAATEVKRAVARVGLDGARTGLVRDLAAWGGRPGQWAALLSAARCLVEAAAAKDKAASASSLVGAGLAMAGLDGPDALPELCELVCVLPAPFENQGWQRAALAAIAGQHLADPGLIAQLEKVALNPTMTAFSWRAFPDQVSDAWAERTPGSRVKTLALLGRGVSAFASGDGATAVRSAARAMKKAVEAAFPGGTVGPSLLALCDLAGHCADADDVYSGMLLLARALRAGFAVPPRRADQDAAARAFEAALPSRAGILAEASRRPEESEAGPPRFARLVDGAPPRRRVVPLASPVLELPEDVVGAALSHLMAGLGVPTPTKLIKKRACEVLAAAEGVASCVAAPVVDAWAPPPPAPSREPPASVSRDDIHPPPAWVRDPPRGPPVSIHAAHDAFAERRDAAEDILLQPSGDGDGVKRHWVATYRDPESGRVREVLYGMSELPRAVQGFESMSTRGRPPAPVRVRDAPPDLRDLAARLCSLPAMEANTSALPAPMRRNGTLGEHALWLIDSGQGESVPEHRAFLAQTERAGPLPAYPLP